MATLVFTALGTAIGGPLGGVVGALVGGQVDSALLGSGSVKGPRLKELDVTTSSYGTPLARHFGRMRAPGTVIWSTDLNESSDTDGGKNRPDVTTYSYSVSFAVALSSRRVDTVGRIWADGKLMRGAQGDLKVGGEMRFYPGNDDQEPDPLILAAEGADRAPAFRGIAYVVFEDLDLSEYYNRLPTLTFEIISGDEVNLAQVVGEVIDQSDAEITLAGLSGYSADGPVIDALRPLAAVYPIDADSGPERLTITRERLQNNTVQLPEPAIYVDDDAFGGRSGFARRRSPVSMRPPEVLRYYDVERDYQPGIQRALGRPGPGQPETIELAASLGADAARQLIEQARRRIDWSRDRIAWRSAELDPAIGPGTIVSLPGRDGRWRVDEWEWRAGGIELGLGRVVPTGADIVPALPTDGGQFEPPVDAPTPPSELEAFELPWDGRGSGDTPAIFAAVSSSGSTWAGAALYAEDGAGELTSLGSSGRARSVIGSAATVLPPANPLLIDRSSSLDVSLVSTDFELPSATARQLSTGANRAIVGDEIIQFAFAQPLGDARWRLSGLLRGRGGTEAKVDTHIVGERFVLLDQRIVALDAAIVGPADDVAIVAVGRGDVSPIESRIALRGITVRPLSPVHPRIHTLDDGSLTLRWTRRARGAWLWLDGVETPLHEEAEHYQVIFGDLRAPTAVWLRSTPELVLSLSELEGLNANLPGGKFHVRQHGSYAVSPPLYLGSLV